jgi:hypothetical protein
VIPVALGDTNVDAVYGLIADGDGRRSQRDVLDRLIEAVRAGESRALVVRGEPGLGSPRSWST